MAPSVVYETVCPACSRTFDLTPGATEGNCPHCQAYLRFVEEEVPEQPAPTDTPAPTPTAPIASASAHEAAVELPPPRVGEFRLDCAACHRGFNVDAEASSATCPHCLTPLELEDQFAERGIEFAVACPNCSKLHEVPRDVGAGACPHCDARLEYDNVYAEEAAVEAPRAAQEKVLAPPTEETPATQASLRETSLQPMRQAPAEPEPAPEPAPELAPDVPVARTGPDGLPITVDCPSCRKGFAVPKDAAEGNCPHCNVPLAFITEKEYRALQEAEERKKQFQAKLAARRQAKKEKELEKARKRAEKEQAEVTVSTPPGVEAAAPTSPASTGAPKGKKGPKPAEATPAPTPESTAAVASPEGKRSRFAFLKRSKNEPDQAPPAASAPVELGEISVGAEPAPASKKGRKASEPPPALVDMEPISIEAPATPAPAAVEMEEISIEAPATPAPAPSKSSKRQPAPAPMAMVEMEPISFDAPPTPSPPRKRAKGTPQAAPEPTLASSGLEISVDEIAAAAAESAAPPAAKKGLFGRFRKPKPDEQAPAAVVEMGDISMDAAPAQPLQSKSKKSKDKAPAAAVEMGDITFDAPASSAPSAAPKKGKKQAAAEPAAVEFGEVSFDAPATAPPKPGKPKRGAAAVETAEVSIDAAPSQGSAIVEMGDVVFESAPAAAPEAEISIDMGETRTPAKKRRR